MSLSGELGNVQSVRTSRRQSGSIQRLRHRSAHMPTTISSPGLRAFARERARMPAGRRSCPSLTFSRAAGPKSDKTIRPRSSTRKRCRAGFGRMLTPASISPRSKISSLYIGCARCRAFMASRGSRRRQRLRTATLKTCSLRCAARRSLVTRTGCRRSSSLGKASSSILTRPRSGDGSRATRPRRATTG